MGHMSYERGESASISPSDGERFGRGFKITAALAGVGLSLAIAGVGLSLAIAGNIGERLLQDNYLEVDDTQRKELYSANQLPLTKIGHLPFDETGHYEGTVEDKEKANFHNSLAVQLKVEGDAFIIDGQGHHTGFTSQSHTPFNDPASFKLTYKLDSAKDNVHVIPAEPLKKVMDSGRMSTDAHYDLTEKRPSLGRGDKDGMGTHHTEAGMTMHVSPTGELTEIRAGEGALFKTGDNASGELKELYGYITGEVQRVNK
jgi:hypothetical protein